MARFLRICRSVGAVAAGYAVIVLGTILILEVALGGIGYQKSSTFVLLAATAGTAVAGCAGGFVAAALAGRNPFEHALAVLLPLTVDTAFVISSGISQDPVWFDLAGSAILMATAVLGGLLRSNRVVRRQNEALAG